MKNAFVIAISKLNDSAYCGMKKALTLKEKIDELKRRVENLAQESWGFDENQIEFK